MVPLSARVAKFINQQQLGRVQDEEALFLWKLLQTPDSPGGQRPQGQKQLLTSHKQVSNYRSNTESSGEFLEPEGFKDWEAKVPA